MRRVLTLAATAALLAGCGIAPSDVTETGIPAPVAAIPSPKNFLVLYKGSKPYRAPIRLRDPDYDSLLTQLFADRRKGTNTALQDLTFEGSRTTPRNDGGVSPRVEEERPTTLEVYISGGRPPPAAPPPHPAPPPPPKNKNKQGGGLKTGGPERANPKNQGA
ncbi:hypothetical protein ACIBH1_33055, partial [Nonomuraea sp. NPDC050663]|uniref:hypothetical protein n=1 Tax=Nonomuraea sp. NPDC050663 TaxID=3364370 RepID=UPI0037B102D3